jgi:hypothetical protein
MNGLETLLKNLRVLADEAEAIRARSARLGIQLSLMADQIESAILKQQAAAASAAPGEKSEGKEP